MKIFTQKANSIFILMAMMLVMNIDTYAKWDLKTDYPIFAQGRWGMQMMTINNKIFAGGGYEGNNTVGNEWTEYDIATDKWAAKGSMPGTNTNRAGGVTFTINGKGYLGMGIENFNSFTDPWTFLTDLWEYDADNDKWNKKADMPGVGVGYAGVFVINNKAYVVGGNTGKNSADGTNQVYEYDPATDKWTKKANYPGSFIKNQPFAFALNGKGYISCGQISGSRTDETYEYDPVADKWTKKKAFPGGEIAGGVSFVANGVAYCGMGGIAGGINNSDYPLTFYYYKPETDSWHYAAGMEFPLWGRMYAQVGVIGDKVYLLAGWRIDDVNQRWFRDLHVIDAAVAVNIDNVITNNNLVIYPNPATDELHINNASQYSSYTVYDIAGRTMASSPLHNDHINIKHFPQGNYILELRTTNEIIREQFNKY